MSGQLIGLVVYLGLMLGIGAWTWKYNKTKEDFILGGRKLGAWVIAFSERTAAESAWLLLGLSGMVFLAGISELWTVFGCVTGIILSWFIIARRIRVKSEEYNAITLPEYFHKAAGGSNAVRVISMLIIVFFYAFYLSAQFVGTGKVLTVTFNMNYTWGVIIGALVIILYTLMGGFMAVCYTDVVQAILMITTLVLLPLIGLIFLFNHSDAVIAALEATRNTVSWTGGKSGWASAGLIIGGLSWGFGYMGQPHLVTKFMAIKSPDKIKLSRSIAIIWTFFAYGGAVLIGIVGIAMLHNGHITESLLNVKGAMDQERILPVLTNFLFPAWMAGILISGAVAAIMSTADSQLLISTSTVVEDFYSRALRKNIAQKKLVIMSRWITLLIGILGLIVAFSTKDIIYRNVSYAWSGLGASFGPALLMTLYWKKTNSRGVIAGMLTGSISTIIWMLFKPLDKIISVRFSSFILAFVAVIVASLWKSESQKIKKNIKR